VNSITCVRTTPGDQRAVTPCYKGEFVLSLILSILAAIHVFLRSRGDTALEVLARRHQVAVLKRKRPRPPWNCFDRLLWSTVRHSWTRWRDVLVIAKPETCATVFPRTLRQLGLADPQRVGTPRHFTVT
jgi:hypothetical protein